MQKTASCAVTSSIWTMGSARTTMPVRGVSQGSTHTVHAILVFEEGFDALRSAHPLDRHVDE